MQDSDYSEAQRTEVQGRWTICPRTAGSDWDFAFKAGVVARMPGVSAVPCDAAAVERVAFMLWRLRVNCRHLKLEDDRSVLEGFARALLEAAGEGGSGDA